jgi:hypothetical protein
MQGAREHAEEIETLWNSQVGEDQGRIDLIAAHVLRDQTTAQSAPATSSKPEP